ncbi:fatty acid desaturase family protein [Streptomyces kanamyceticus]|uniref:Fatty acid desaturase n=1 Tax=Streptomyces kanamyceticus TaxID=1967 RepID=A0A5J6G632_STRKN|nr:fatty acid desaturase [Streptomyces kanamyceticus]QEU90182.1 fatty acid desaturase [Streptomyces kanamyceticus]
MTVADGAERRAIPWEPELERAMSRFSVKEAHDLLHGLFRPRMRIYWTDFLLSVTVGAVAFWAVDPLGGFSVLGVLAFLVSVFAVFRCFAFIHEIAHFRKKQAFGPFRLGWNVLFGIPMMIPIFMYECHGEHHNRKLYGTPQDAEYLPLARMAPSNVVGLLITPLVLPFFGPYRFGIVTPLSWCVPKVREYLYRNLSALKIDFDYRGRQPTAEEKWSWRLQEFLCLAWIAAAAVLLSTGTVPIARLVQWYALFVAVAFVNSLRLLAAHRYIGDEDEMSIVEQMMDTVNHPRARVLGELWAPVGLRLHALHHLMPGLPYHNYPVAHARLMAGLPEDSAYRLTESPGLFPSLRRLWSACRAHQRAGTLLDRTSPEGARA